VVTVLEKGDAERFEKRSWREGFFILMVLARVPDVRPSGESGVLKNGMDLRRLLGVEGKLPLVGNSTGSLANNCDCENSTEGLFSESLGIEENKGSSGDDEGVASDSADEDGVGPSGDIVARASGSNDSVERPSNLEPNKASSFKESTCGGTAPPATVFEDTGVVKSSASR
jgi:hypothetical protein